jgi:hypothetical protein
VRNPGSLLTVELQRGYSDDAELDLGWSYAAPGDTAHAGRWERGVPQLTGLGRENPVQPGSDNTPGFGNHAFITGIAGSGDGVGANDIDDGETSLTTPPMDLTGYVDPVIRCAIWYSRDGRGDAINDTLLAMIAPSSEGPWTVMERITASPREWTQKQYHVEDFIAPGARTHFRLVASDLHAQSLVEAGLDDFSVSGAPSSAPDDIASPGSGLTYALHPNPFADAAMLDITFAAPQRHARLDLYNTLGERVRTLYDGAVANGTTSFPIEGAGLPSGRYIWRLTLDDGSVVTGGASLVR